MSDTFKERRSPDRPGGLETAVPCFARRQNSLVSSKREEFLAGEAGTLLLLVVGFRGRRRDELDRSPQLRCAK